ncbi:MAG: hypothetical protein H6R06_1553 [Proteobacteria bacterium]|jgi:uncharacterized protein (DUF924 family)|nr:hypothetical protein [Pseudomonadota bacterium]
MNDAAIDPRAAEVLDFWFGKPGEAHHLQTRPEWFRKDEAFDALIAQRFGTLIDAGLRSELAPWAAQPLSALAQIVVLDQFTRNTRRGTAGVFAGDAQALATARALVAAGDDLRLAGVQRQFVYLPFEHSETLADQTECLRLFEQLGRDEPALAGLLEWAQKHYDIVARFGRFPHRNAALGRNSTAEEIEFLKQPGSGF